MEIVAPWLIMGGVVAMIASSKGKSAAAWFLCGALIWPIALVHVLLTSAERAATDAKNISAGGKKCPKCAEIVKREALVCRLCGNEDFPALFGYPVDKYGRTVIDNRKNQH